MSCFPCFSSQRSKSLSLKEPPVARAIGPNDASSHPAGNGNPNSSSEANGAENNSKTFTFRELAAATKNFRQECLLGEGGFGRVYKGTLQSSGQVVAVKQLDRNGMHGNKEFQVEVMMLSLLHHPNLVNLIGYCADGDQRLLVYEFLPFGSLDDHLLDLGDGKKPLDWGSRMKIASGAAQGLEYLHEKANPPIIYRDLKSSNILLDEDFNARLSDYGLAKLGVDGGKMHVSPRVMGTYGYCAPEYERTGELTLKSDVYSFGVILLELLTGRRAVDTARPTDEQNLVSWAQPYFRDPKRFPELADPRLNSRFPVKCLNQAVGVAAMCLQEEPAVRPLIGDVVAALSFLTMSTEEIPSPKLEPAPSQDQSEGKTASDDESRRSDSSDEQDENSDQEDDDQSSGSSDGDGDDDDDDGDGQCDTSVDNNQEEPEKPPEKVKKSVKWASRCRSKGGSGSISSRSSKKSSDNDDEKSNNKATLKPGSSKKLASNSIQKSEEESSSQVASSSAHHSNNSSLESTDRSFATQGSIPKSNGEAKPEPSKLSKAASRDESSDSSSSDSSDDDDESSQGGVSIGRSSRSSSNVGSHKYAGSSSVSRRDSSRESYGESAASYETRSDSSSSSSDSGSEDQNANHDQIRRCSTTNGSHPKKSKVGFSSKSTNYTGSEDIRSLNTSSRKSKNRDS